MAPRKVSSTPRAAIALAGFRASACLFLTVCPPLLEHAPLRSGCLVRVEQTDITAAVAAAVDDTVATAQALAFVFDNSHSLLRAKVVRCRAKMQCESESEVGVGAGLGRAFVGVGGRRTTSAF